MIFLDTHIIVWLHQKSLSLLSDRAKRMIDGEELCISPVVLLEIEYLYEIGRLNCSSDEIFEYLNGSIGLNLSTHSFSDIVKEACKIKWTREPFDRLITAQAAIDQNELVTKDETIRNNYPYAVW